MAIYGRQPYGEGTAAVALDGGGKPITNPYSGLQNGSRKIDPFTRDYVVDSTTGRPQGMTNAQQLVYLAVRTDKGSSAMRALGQELMRIQRITSNFVRRVDDTLKSAVQHIVDRGIIQVVGTQVDIVRPGVAKARIRWRDLETGNVEVTEIGHIDQVSQAPALFALSYDLVDTAGGTPVSIVGSGLTDATSVTVGGTSATVTLNTATMITFTMPAKTAGTYSVVVTTARGTSNSLTIEAWSPSTVASLTGYWAPSFTGSPWVGAVGGNLSTVGTVPAVSSAVNGFTGADFSTNKGLVTASTAATYLTAAAYTMITLVYVRSFTVADPGNGNAQACASIFSASTLGSDEPKGGLAGTGTSGVYRFGQGANSAACNISTGTWTMLMARWNGTNIEVGRNNEATVSNTAVNAVLTKTMRFGQATDGSAVYLDAIVLSGALHNAAISDSDRDKYRRYFNSKYALSL